MPIAKTFWRKYVERVGTALIIWLLLIAVISICGFTLVEKPWFVRLSFYTAHVSVTLAFLVGIIGEHREDMKRLDQEMKEP